RADNERVGRRVQAGAEADELVEGDGGAKVLEEDAVRDAGDVPARREEVHRGGDEVVAGRASEVGEVVGTAARRGALEGVGLEARSSLLGAPRGVEIVQGDSYVLGVPVARAEDDGLLLGPDRRQEVPEEVPAHR